MRWNKTTRNDVRRALLERRVSVGSWIQLGYPGIAEVLSNVGFDWIAVDCEHTDIGVDKFTSIARAMYGRGPVPLARVRENDTLAIRQILDAGAEGVIVPLVNTADDARRAVAAAKYLPVGERGFAFARANDYGVRFDDYVSHANEDVLVVVMAESREAVENIHEILAVDGVDGVFIGPYDMSGSYGVIGQLDHPLITEAFFTICEACRDAGKAAGIHIVTPDQEAVHKALEAGFTFIAIGMDDVFLDRGARNALEMIQRG